MSRLVSDLLESSLTKSIKRQKLAKGLNQAEQTYILGLAYEIEVDPKVTIDSDDLNEYKKNA